MKKVILAIVLIIIVAIVGAVYYVFTNLDSLIEAAIEQYGSQATQTAVRVDKVKLSLTDGSGSISGMSIANPTGYVSPLAFSLGEIRIGVDLQSLQQQPYIINEITVLAPQVFVDINKEKLTNLNQLKDNLNKSMAAAQGGSAAGSKPSSSAAEPRLIIRRVRFAEGNIKARVEALDNKEYELKLPALDMANLGGKQGATATQLANEIIKRLTDSASERVKQKIINEKLGALKAQTQEKIDAEKALLQQQADTKLNQQTDTAKEKLKGLFNK